MTMTQVKWQFLPEPTFGFASNTIEDEFCQARAHIQNFYFDTSHKLATIFAHIQHSHAWIFNS